MKGKYVTYLMVTFLFILYAHYFYAHPLYPNFFWRPSIRVYKFQNKQSDVSVNFIRRLENDENDRYKMQKEKNNFKKDYDIN